MSQVLSEKYESQPGRMKILNGIKNTVIIDDSYNSSTLAVEKALETLDELVSLGGRKIAVLGDMMELGKYSIEEHKKAGKQAAKVCDILVTVGLRSRHTVEGALNGGMNDGQIQQFEDSRKAGLFLQNFIQEKDIILVKGSRWATRMERTVEEIMAEPEKKGELLVG
jgi:UDP-N-acetylmuramoyl-tripeptide--D-alanyl-D-alanine ligase